MRNTTKPSGVSIANKVKQLFPEQYKIAVEAVIKENKEFNCQYMKKMSLRYKPGRAERSRAYYLAHREAILAKAREYRNRTDYDNKRKLKGIHNESKVKQTEIADKD